MTYKESDNDKDFVRRAIEISIHVGLLVAFVAACLMILRPFLSLIVWGIVLAIAIYPGYKKLQRALGGRGTLAAVLCTVFLLGFLVVPAILLTKTLVQGVQTVTAHIQDGTPVIPPPPTKVGTWPIIGPPLNGAWQLASADLTAAIKKFAPQINPFVHKALSATAEIGVLGLEFMLSILLAGVLLANAPGCVKVVRSLANRLFGDRGAEVVDVSGATIRSVTNGILGVALIQSAFAGVGFLLAGLPAAGLWTIVFLVGAVLQVRGLVFIPAVIYMFATAGVTKAVIFLIWCIIVGLMDNVLKPLLLGRGGVVPVAVIFVGVIGGFMAMGIIGLFVGAIILSVSYRLFLTWLGGTAAADAG